MATVELPAHEPTEANGHWRGHAFGLTLESAAEFPGLQAGSGEGSEQTTAWNEISAEEIDGAWHVADGDVLVEKRHVDGRLFLRIDHGDDLGYRIWAPYYGRHLISTDAARIDSALPRVPPARWQRLFFAQVLPLAAALRGRTLFHASAAALDGKVVALLGPSGAGKTSLTAHLVALGASFFTDDVLAFEVTESGVVAHPGPARLTIEPHELARIPSTQEARLGGCVGRSDKLMLEPQPYPSALPVSHLYFLRPEPAGGRIAIAEREGSPGRSLLSASFLTYLSSPDYLSRHLEVCARLDATARLYDVHLPHGCRARDAAVHVLAHRQQSS
ncbi:MAG TPA: hypothetical protein VH297_06120 [Gaiellaceae bacterium]|jgi:hypothetical protein